jgi:hypothetical protein
MNINSIHPVTGAAAYDSYQAQAPKRKPVVSGTGLPKENIELSDNSVNLKKIHDAIVAMPEIRIPAVEKIKERIKNNDYPIENHFNKALERMRDQNILSIY